MASEQELKVGNFFIDETNFLDIAKYRKKGSQYNVGDFVYYAGTPSYIRLFCIQAGVTGEGNPDFSTVKDNEIVIDGTVKWRAEDLRNRPFILSDMPVGAVDYQYFLMDNYVALDGSDLAKASEDYSELLEFAQSKKLIGTAAQYSENKLLFKYNEQTDVLTLPNFIGLVLQGSLVIGEIKAGLPNIKGTVVDMAAQSANGAFSKPQGTTRVGVGQGYARFEDLSFDASRSNSIYGKSNTVQPPASGIIPQIKYRRDTRSVSSLPREETYSLNEQRIGTWIDNKPLYQITVSFTTPSSASQQSYSFLPTVPFSNIDTLVDIEGWVERSDGWRAELAFSYGSDLYYYFDWNKNSSQIYFLMHSSVTSRPSILTFKYTKKSD